jgi:hypothetical protein
MPSDALRISAIGRIGNAPRNELFAGDARVETADHEPKPSVVVAEVLRIGLAQIGSVVVGLGKNVAEGGAHDTVPLAINTGVTWMNDKPDPEHGIYRVTHGLRVGDAQHTCESDLVFMSGKPFVVLEWEDRLGSQYPMIKLPLDEKLLHAESPQGYFVYSGPALVDPRPVH